jgi:hypothetical protein
LRKEHLMSRRCSRQAAFILFFFALAFSLLPGRTAAEQHGIVARFLGIKGQAEKAAESPDKSVRADSVHPLAVTATPTPSVITFNPAAVGISVASAQSVKASFSVSGYAGSFIPTATLHYGHDYTLGTVTCSGSGPETCTVSVTFQPTLPGARKDALFLMDGTTILTTVLLGGTGQAPLALVQPGVVTSPITSAPYYIYQSTVDENGTVYFVADEGNAVYSLAKGSTIPSTVPVTGLSSPHAIAIDGAGVLYIAQNTYSHDIITYNTVTGAQGSITVNPPAPYVPCSNTNDGTLEYLYSVAIDDAGNLFTLEILCNQIFELAADGTYTTTPISPAMTQPSEIGIDDADDVFIGGYDINELTAGGAQTQINNVGAGDGVAADAADTVYATRYTDYGGVVGLLASNYSTPGFTLDPSASPLGEGLASDGTLWVGNYSNLDKVDRTQGTISFGEQTVNFESAAQDVSLYNGGNESLTVSSIVISGAPFNLLPGGSNNCTAGIVIAPGSSCEIAVTITPTHAGNFTGTVTFTSDSLNTTATQQNVALSGFVYGAYMVASPTVVNFPQQAAGTTSAAAMVTLTNDGLLYGGAVGAPSSSNAAFNPTSGTCSGQIAVGSSCQVSVTFSPALAQAYAGTVTVPASTWGGGAIPSVTFNVNGSGVTTATLTPAGLAFGKEAVGATGPVQTATLKNTGTVALPITAGGITISGPGAASFKVTATTCAASLNSGSSCTISASFKPAALGNLSATLNVADGALGSPQTVALTGTGAASVTLAPADLTFAATKVGSWSTGEMATLKNTGTVPLTISAGGITITGTHASSFIEATTCGTALAPGADCTISVRFKPVTTGILTATLEVADDAIGSPQQVALKGTGDASAALTPATLAFAGTAVGATSAAKIITLKNNGTAALDISTGGITITGTHASSFIKTTTCGSVLAAGASCTISVKFKPKATGALTATLEVADNALGSPQKVALSGTGEALATLTPTSLAFASTHVGTVTAAKIVTLKNSGTVPLTIAGGGITITGSHASSFTKTTTCGASLAAGHNCTVSVKFKPTTTGALTAVLNVADDAAGSPQKVTLSGTGH